jgi:hypothetical protein
VFALQPLRQGDRRRVGGQAEIEQHRVALT